MSREYTKDNPYIFYDEYLDGISVKKKKITVQNPATDKGVNVSGKEFKATSDNFHDVKSHISDQIDDYIKDAESYKEPDLSMDKWIEELEVITEAVKKKVWEYNMSSFTASAKELENAVVDPLAELINHMKKYQK